MRRSARRRFAYRLALKLGVPDVERWLSRMSAKQLRQWEMYAECEPFDEALMGYRIASIVSMLYNVNRGKGQKALGPDAFILGFDKRGPATAAPKRQTWQEQKAMWLGPIVAALSPKALDL